MDLLSAMLGDGTYKWYQGIQGTDNINVTSVEETSQGIVVSADFLGTIQVNGSNVAAKGQQDSIIIGYTTSGQYSWYQQIGSTNEETIVKLVVDEEDYVWALGGFSGALTVPTSVTPKSTNYTDGLAMKFASTGEYVTYFSYGGTAGDDMITSMTSLSDDGILFGGWYASTTIDIDGDGTNDVTTNKGSGMYDGIVIKLDDSNQFEWTRTFQGDNFDPVYGVAELTDESILVIGNYDSTKLLDNGTDEILSVKGYSDVYMLNLGSVVTAAEVPLLQELEITNNLEKFKITTEIGENYDEQRNGGTITGTPTSTVNVNLVEEVKNGYDGESQIVITPDTNYSIYSITIDGEEVTTYVPDENGIVTIPAFEEVKENHHIIVVFEKNVSSVLVHHYLKNRDGEYTETKLAEDEYIAGKIGANYTTWRKILIVHIKFQQMQQEQF